MFCEVVENICALAIIFLLEKPEFVKLALYGVPQYSLNLQENLSKVF